MKKTLLFTFAFLFAMATMAQNRAVILEESFNGGSMPAGWSTAGMGTSNWSISSTQNAGGTPKEVKLTWSPQFNGTSRLVTPAVDLTGVSSVAITFKHALDNYSGGHTLGVATTSDDGTTWNVGWSQTYSANGSWLVLQEINTPDMDHENVKFCIFYTGNSYNMNNWYFDDIQIFVREETDANLAAVNVADFNCGSEPGILSADVNVGMTVLNYGMNTITSIEATYEVEGFAPVTEVFNANITSMASQTLSFNETITLDPGSYDLNITINKVNGEDDIFTDNNSFSKTFSVAMATTDRIPMIEHFSSSSCSPCVSVNNQMNTFCNNNPGRYTYTKYAMNWPGNGDPYYTSEGNVRRTYYGINSVPTIFLDGVTSTPVNQTLFNQHAEQPGFFDIRGSFTVDGNVINVIADITPYVSTQARVYISVNEKETHNNVGGNGETTFHHVMMKMLPNGEGTTINFVGGENQHLEFTQNMSTTHVEEMSDLEVSIWIQNYNSMEVYNSHFAYEYTEHPYPVENLTMVENGGDKDVTFVATWDAPAEGSPIGYKVYVNGEVVVENTTETNYSFEGDPEQFYVIEVVALYADDKVSVKAAAAVTYDQGLIADTDMVSLDENNPFAEITVTNANYGSLMPIEILSITEETPTGEPYLEILADELPLTLEAGESYRFSLTPNNAIGERSVARTTVMLESDAGTLEFIVEIDGELLSVNEISSETRLYPNPTMGNFTVEGSNVSKVEVYNLVGQKVCEQQGKVVNIDASSWNKGLYLVNVTSQEGAVQTMKLVVK